MPRRNTASGCDEALAAPSVERGGHGSGDRDRLERIAPEGVRVYNPAFDVTPADLIAGIVTEKGLIAPVNEAAIRQLLA